MDRTLILAYLTWPHPSWLHFIGTKWLWSNAVHHGCNGATSQNAVGRIAYAKANSESSHDQCDMAHTHSHLMALCPGLSTWVGTGKVKPIWIYRSKRQWHGIMAKSGCHPKCAVGVQCNLICSGWLQQGELGHARWSDPVCLSYDQSQCIQFCWNEVSWHRSDESGWDKWYECFFKKQPYSLVNIMSNVWHYPNIVIRRDMGHIGDFLPSRTLGLVLKTKHSKTKWYNNKKLWANSKKHKLSNMNKMQQLQKDKDEI